MIFLCLPYLNFSDPLPETHLFFNCPKDKHQSQVLQFFPQMDGFLFYKKNIPYTSGPTSDILWTKPFILPDIFDGLALSKKIMNTRPESYTSFEKFVEDIQNGKNPIKKDKKKSPKGKGGPFLPQRELNLPPPPPLVAPVREQVKGRGRGRKVKQYSYYGPGTERVYGRGRASGYNYYGDGRDVYYPPGFYPGGQGHGGGQGRGGYGSTGRKLTKKQQQEMFAMGDMQAALSQDNYDTHQKQRRRPLYQQN